MSLARTLRTARDLRPEQIAQRLWNRARGPWFASPLYARARLAPRKVPVPERFPPAPWPGTRRTAKGILAGDIRLLAQEHPLRSPVDWRAFDRSPLWQFTLHSFEWLADLAELHDAEAAARARAVIDDWITAHPRPGTVAWHPYPTSLRVYAWLRHAPLILAGADAAFEHRFTAALDRQARHLARVVERDVGGNHLIKNLKALIAAERCLDGPSAPWALGELEREVGRQVLADGGHYERSPSYHLQVLGDLIDLRGLLAQTHESPPWLDDALNRMGGALAFLRHGDGGLALFNDGDVGDPAVLAAVEGLLGDTPAVPRVLDETGYYRLPGGETLVLMDAGSCCPDDLPAHAHADTLSFELSAGSQRIVVNCGTYAYQDATWRNRLRGTAAHSTLSVDDENSAEVYDVFRVGRRPRVVAGRMTEAAGDIWRRGASRRLPPPGRRSPSPADARRRWIAPPRRRSN